MGTPGGRPDTSPAPAGRRSARAARARVGGQHHQVGVLAELERADHVVGEQLPGRVEGLRPDRLLDRQPLLGRQHPPTGRLPGGGDADVAQRLLRGDRRVVVQRDAHAGGHRGTRWHPTGSAFLAEQAVDEDVTPVVDLVDEDAAGDAEPGGPLELIGPDGADVLEPQPVVVARMAFEGLLVDVEDGVDAGVALHVAGQLPAQREVGADDLVQLLCRVVGAAAGAGGDADGAGGLGVQVGERQRDVADPGRAVHPDLDADLAQHVVALARGGVGAQLRVGDLVAAQPHRQLPAQLFDQRPEPRVERHLRTGGQPGPVQPRALGVQHPRVAGGVDGAVE